MATAIRIEALPARLGDCLLVECLREGGRPWRMLVDGGPPDTWPQLEARLAALPAADPGIDVAVVTHIDSDHIGGMIPFLRSEFAHTHVGDVWFNGRCHLPDPNRGPVRSVKQGEDLTAELTGVPVRPNADPRRDRALPWNLAFGGGPIQTGDEGGHRTMAVDDGPTITVLSPTTKRLAILAPLWDDALRAVTRGSEGIAVPDSPAPLDDLVRLAAPDSARDRSAPNGSSIALLVEHRGASVLLAGDAFGNVLGAGLVGLAAARGTAAVPVDVFKLPHHGSRGNVLAALVERAPARHYIVSSNGDVFHHPDDAALARVVLGMPAGATLWFNYANERTRRWDAPRLRDRHDYETRYPIDDSAGAVLELAARP